MSYTVLSKVPASSFYCVEHYELTFHILSIFTAHLRMVTGLKCLKTWVVIASFTPLHTYSKRLG